MSHIGALPRLAFHETETELVGKILREGIKCKEYPEHPLGGPGSCLVFLYPHDVIFKAVSFWPMNAKMQGVDDLDTLSILCVNMDGIEALVGDLYLETEPERYKASVVSYDDYIAGYRKFQEAEIVVSGDIPPDRIVGSMVYSKFTAVFKECNFDLSCIYNAYRKSKGLHIGR